MVIRFIFSQTNPFNATHYFVFHIFTLSVCVCVLMCHTQVTRVIFKHSGHCKEKRNEREKECATIYYNKVWKIMEKFTITHINGCISQTFFRFFCPFLITHAKYASKNVLQCECAYYTKKSKWNEQIKNYKATTRKNRAQKNKRVILTRHKNEQTNRQK